MLTHILNVFWVCLTIPAILITLPGYLAPVPAANGTNLLLHEQLVLPHHGDPSILLWVIGFTFGTDIIDEVVMNLANVPYNFLIGLHRRITYFTYNVNFCKHKFIDTVTRQFCLLPEDDEALPKVDHILQPRVYLGNQILKLGWHLLILVTNFKFEGQPRLLYFIF